jgi:hypothetical protein
MFRGGRCPPFQPLPNSFLECLEAGVARRFNDPFQLIFFPISVPIDLNWNTAGLMREICPITRPFPIGRVVTKTGSHWIKVNVIQLLLNEPRSPEINRREILEPQGMRVRSTLWNSQRKLFQGSDMIRLAQPIEDLPGRGALQSSHYRTNIEVQRIENQMNVIRHHNVANQLKPAFFAGLSQGVDKKVTSYFAAEYRNTFEADRCRVMKDSDHVI